ncbi:MAG: hypothetical protein FWB84_07795 [Candidatus Bathyarchaeota archaeon]|uniref:hypothetical protein n=1 Tax=Candidatus Bathycorpusculum sp. TaxID=2994959 RepID=UPI002838A6F6|nr:hypothetical protein [Candidatus Termiticorpusculum sp.]MCL2258097.1 hypothetical protein [Candidatus Termiticorpusculum sp.]MCL2291645.1 hypothetical protein [Candidatus Termiticorpusculum sp.]
MSDLASSCEYLSLDKTCTVFNDASKAKTSRQLNCKNDLKTMCCYLCIFRLHCPINCTYLGQSENYAKPKSIPKDTLACTVDKTLKDEPLPLESIPVAFCFSCNVEMAWAKTQFAVEHWSGNKPSLIGDKLLPVTVLLCSKCGKIEFKANLAKKEEHV